MTAGSDPEPRAIISSVDCKLSKSQKTSQNEACLPKQRSPISTDCTHVISSALALFTLKYHKLP